MYLHAYFAPSGLALDPTDPFYQNSTVFGKIMGEKCPTNPFADNTVLRYSPSQEGSELLEH